MALAIGLPSAILKKRSEKFDIISFNWHYIKLLVKILCIFGLFFLFLHHASTYEWIKMNIYIYIKWLDKRFKMQNMSHTAQSLTSHGPKKLEHWNAKFGKQYFMFYLTKLTCTTFMKWTETACFLISDCNHNTYHGNTDRYDGVLPWHHIRRLA